MATTLSLDHVALPALDAAATRAFYRDVLGLSLVSALEGPDWDGQPWLMMIFSDPAGHQLALCAFSRLRAQLDREWPKDARHYAFAVNSLPELAAWKARLDAAGVAWRQEDHGEQLSIYFDDPNGTGLEITAHRSEPSTKPSAEADAIVDSWIAHNP
jgi:catechol 2,3-dioxygenase-like lactoylglutathione lyase family enzyme